MCCTLIKGWSVQVFVVWPWLCLAPSVFASEIFDRVFGPWLHFLQLHRSLPITLKFLCAIFGNAFTGTTVLSIDNRFSFGFQFSGSMLVKCWHSKCVNIYFVIAKSQFYHFRFFADSSFQVHSRSKNVLVLFGLISWIWHHIQLWNFITLVFRLFGIYATF